MYSSVRRDNLNLSFIVMVLTVFSDEECKVLTFPQSLIVHLCSRTAAIWASRSGTHQPHTQTHCVVPCLVVSLYTLVLLELAIMCIIKYGTILLITEHRCSLNH